MKEQQTLMRGIGALVGLCLFILILVMETPEGLQPEGQRAAAVAVLMAFWWVARVFPLAVTALVPLVAFPVLGVIGIADAARPFAHHLNFLMLGGFVMGFAMEEVGLHRRVVAALLRFQWVRKTPPRVVGALMVSGAVLSALISNTATMLMLLPVASALAARCTQSVRQRSAFVLGLAYSTSIGGTMTLVGTPPNALLANAAPSLTFASWMTIGVPFALLSLPLAWWVITHVSIPLPATFERPPEPEPARPWSVSEVLVLGVIMVAMALWLTRKPIQVEALGIAIPGWSQWFADPAMVQDAWVAIFAALVLFLVPGQKNAKPPRPFLLEWKRVEQAIPWSVLLLLGGGFSLASAIQGSGLTAWLAQGMTGLGAWMGPEGPPWGSVAAVAVICLVMTFLTELTSNTATTTIVLPILAAAATSAGLEPTVWMIPATLSASCAFMMPVATGPNAVASEAGGVAPRDMAVGGLALNLLCVATATTVTTLLVM
jgi:sodium-dependent dicarboxylate transporter 2/3/5